MMTAVIISIRPEALSRPNFSPKCSTPTSTAVSGSIEPRIDVIVEPISLIARTSVRLDTTVGTRASNRRFCQRCHLPGSGAPVVDRAYTRKKQALKSRT